MSPKHLMARIDATYKAEIRRAAKQYAPKGTDWKDMYQEVLIAVYDRVRRRKVGLRDYKAMKNTINQRAIDKSRKALLQHRRFVPVAKVPEIARSSDSPTILEKMRMARLKTKLRKLLPPVDARIVIELIFPSSKTQALARRMPKRKGPESTNVECFVRDWRGRFWGVRGQTVKKWHVARYFGVSEARVGKAMKKAEEIVGDVIVEGEE